eukprot:Lithocolla_globosa_v1_NODE_618_length_3583_cov_3.898810.p5 type:complete len:153 gc:universal NODE_618_length_3583_cov_3.898810:1338-880(-)
MLKYSVTYDGCCSRGTALREGSPVTPPHCSGFGNSPLSSSTSSMTHPSSTMSAGRPGRPLLGSGGFIPSVGIVDLSLSLVSRFTARFQNLTCLCKASHSASPGTISPELTNSARRKAINFLILALWLSSIVTIAQSRNTDDRYTHSAAVSGR